MTTRKYLFGNEADVMDKEELNSSTTQRRMK